MTRAIARNALARDGADDDAALVRRIAAGDLSALGELYARHHAAVRRLTSRVLGSASDADDVTHATFLAIPSLAASFDGRPPRPWLLGIAARLALRHTRSLRRFVAALGAFALVAARTARDAEADAVAREEARVFERAVARLAPKKRAVFLLVEAEGLSAEDVAQALELPVATVRTRLHYARRELRAAMKRGGAWD